MKNEFGMEKKKSDQKFANALFWCWIICWFLSIWILPFRQEFFLTGIFCFGLALLVHKSTKDEKKKEK